MHDLVIVGGGFAGMWAALGAAHEVAENEADIAITVVSKDPYLTIRPRLYERDPETLRAPLAPAFEPLGIALVEGAVTGIDTKDRNLTLECANGGTTSQRYDTLIVATGSEQRLPAVPGLAEHGFDIDTYDAAVAFDRHLAKVLDAPPEPGHDTVVILGAGLTGVELALEMRDRIAAHADADAAEQARIVLVEQADTVGPELGSNPRPVVADALRDAKVELRLGTRLERVELDAAILSSGERIATKSVVVTAGLKASALAHALPVECDELGRVPTDETLHVAGLSNVFVAGDIARAYADAGQLALMSCQHAMAMGRLAGYNAAREAIGLPLKPYSQPNYVTCMDLGRSGAVFTTGWEREVQMTGAEAKARKQMINTQFIYPPTGDREALLAAAHIDARPGR